MRWALSYRLKTQPVWKELKRVKQGLVPGFPALFLGIGIQDFHKLSMLLTQRSFCKVPAVKYHICFRI
jgi:hypothetical protein